VNKEAAMSRKSRKPYKKPQINQVKLIVDEAVLGGCKIQAGNPGMTDKHCTHTKCVSAGS
jgi:hypothetical protein